MLCAAATLFAFVAEGMTNGPAVQLSKADSLRHKQKMVQALMLYESILAELYLLRNARSHTGIAGIQIHAGNLEEAQSHWPWPENIVGCVPITFAAQWFLNCPNSMRSRPTRGAGFASQRAGMITPCNVMKLSWPL